MNSEASRIERIRISQSADVMRLRQQALVAARAVGMSDLEQEEVRIVATELATNVVKHAGTGLATVEWDSALREIVIVTRNPTERHETEGLSENGHSTAGTLGIGLGAVRRLCDTFDLSVENGTLVVQATKRCTEKAASFIETSALSRPLPGFQENGDGYYIKVHGDSAMLAVIDGLGHGPQAAQATLMAISVIAADDRAPLLDIVQRMHTHLRRTRGCVVGLARIHRDGKMEYTGVGNIRAQIFSSGEAKSLLSYSGVVGGSMRTSRVMSYDLPPRGVLVMYSDGVGHLSCSDHLRSRSAMEIASNLFHASVKPTDDATILVARMK